MALLYLISTGLSILTSPDNLIEPLRYLTTKEEYKQLLKAENSKQAVDDFG